MVCQRGYGVTAPAGGVKPKGGRQAALPQTTSHPAKQKLSFKQKHALETLPKEMAKLEAEIFRLNGVLADGSLYAKNPQKFTETGKALEKAQAALGKVEDEWLTLEALRETIEG